MNKLIVSWTVTQKCNLSCKYCFDKTDKKRYPINHIDVDRVIEIFDGLPKDHIQFHFTGGETLLSKDIVDLIIKLSKKPERYSILFNTNLTNTAAINKLVDTANMKAITIFPSLHFDELKRNGFERKFIDNYHLLKNSDIQYLKVSTVGYPGLTKQEVDCFVKFYEDAGIITNFHFCEIEYENKTYPKDYTSEELTKFNFKQEALDVWSTIRKDALSNECIATKDFIFINHDGHAFPCLTYAYHGDMLDEHYNVLTDHKYYLGNIIDGITLRDSKIKCTMKKCECPIYHLDLDNYKVRNVSYEL